MQFPFSTEAMELGLSNLAISPSSDSPMATNRKDEERDWANLPQGIVVQIGEISLTHDLLSYISLRGVCHRWRQAIKNPVNTDRRFRPHNWILIDPVTNLCQSQYVLAEPFDFDQTLCLFLNFSSGKRIQADIPELHNHCIRACVDGLLLLTEIGIADTPTRLLNPFTGAMSDYPALSTLPSEIGLPLSICFASPTASTLVILAECDVAYAVPGLKAWELLSNHNLLWDCRRAEHAYFQCYTYVFSIAKTDFLKIRLTRFNVEEANPGQVDLWMEYIEIDRHGWGWATWNLWGVASLVASNGELLFLNRSQGLGMSDFSFFQVFKVVIKEGINDEVKAHLVRLNNIGKRAILFNKLYEGVSVSSDVFPFIKPNSIYCYHGDSLNIYHPGGHCYKPLYPNIAPPGYCYFPDDNIQFIGEYISVFLAFQFSRGSRDILAMKTYQKLCQKGNREDEERDWTNLPEGIVAQIGEITLAHGLLPYISLRGVCHRWRQATKNPVNTDRRFRPHNWILIDPVTNLCQSQDILAEPFDFDQTLCLFLNFSSSKCIQADIPELRNHCIRACVDGLLLITEIGIADTPTRLLNPFTGAMSDYPALSTLPSEIGLPLSICFASPTTSTLVILAERDVAYVVPGLKEWELLANRNPLWECHIIAHAYFQSYTYVFSITTGCLLEIHLTRFEVEEANPGQVDLQMECIEIDHHDWGWATWNLWGVASLVESNGELLFLSWSRGPGISTYSFFQVFKVVIEEGVNGEVKAHLVHLNNIGKRAILINKVYGSVSVSTDVFPFIKPNSIYCYHGDSLNIYHPGGHCCEAVLALYPNIAPPGYCYWPDDNIQFFAEYISVFRAFQSSSGSRRILGLVSAD